MMMGVCPQALIVTSVGHALESTQDVDEKRRERYRRGRSAVHSWDTGTRVACNQAG